MHQWKSASQDAAADRARLEKEHLKRLITGLRAEIDAALGWADRRREAIEPVLKSLQDARASGAAVLREPIQPGSLVVTDAIIYREIASELGRLPPALIRFIVHFYTLALELGRIADGAPAVEEAYGLVLSAVPRLTMSGSLLIRILDKFEACSFKIDADIRPTTEDLKELAAKTSYPLDQVLRERGFQL
jgi:hypothetical protein